MNLTRRHHQRLRDLYRSAGWPCRDMLEGELLAAGLVARVIHPDGNETMRVTDAGLALLAEVHQANRAARTAHEALVERVALEMSRAGRLAWRGLSLRARVGLEADGNTPAKTADWCIACPDVFSIRNTTVEAYLEPIVHEVKVSRADLLGDLKKPAKRAAYLDLGGQCWYVLASNATGQPIARPEEIPLRVRCDAGVRRQARGIAAGAAQARRPAAAARVAGAGEGNAGQRARRRRAGPALTGESGGVVEQARRPDHDGFRLRRYRCSARTSVSLIWPSDSKGITRTALPSARLPLRKSCISDSGSA